jgi:hypothetical protein
MNKRFIKNIIFASILCALIGSNTSVGAQERSVIRWNLVGGIQNILGQPNMTFVSKLADPAQNAKLRRAVVQLHLTGFQLIDPTAAVGQSAKNQGHFHFQVDDGQIIESTSTEFVINDLSPGQHKIKVMLVGNDHNSVSTIETFGITVPEDKDDLVQETVIDLD